MTAVRYNDIRWRRVRERLRQERETFDQRKDQEKQWFLLRLRMGYTAVAVLLGVAFVSSYVVLDSVHYPRSVVASACIALFTDICGVVAAVWTLALKPGSVTRLAPITIDSAWPECAERHPADCAEERAERQVSRDLDASGPSARLPAVEEARACYE
jgi:hypothetical protein